MLKDALPPAIFLMGPTAAGKTDLALELVRHLPCDIISVDSTLVYRGMDIGTAKPGPDVLATAPHRLIDIRDPSEAYSAAQFRDDALREMAQIIQAGRIPLLVGGTMLYFRALQQGLSDMPSADSTVRARLEAEAGVVGWAALHARLAQVDPAAAQRIHPNDPQRIQRALEVYELGGVPMSDLYKQHAAVQLPYRIFKLILSPADRAVLHRRIGARFHAMLEAGFVDEVVKLRSRGDLHVDLPSVRAVGYRQVWSYLDGGMAYSEMVERAIIATRQFAKRQMTWLRSTPDAVWFDGGQNIFDEVLQYLAGALIIKR
ncbi:MAG: tRNA (adenosine(37)-N6)-dimethylallyltransferase MiaA [Gammaproteobacteria bacterium]|nr:tRNA (adenosine(37)-N6)-dimethylallyltransferase MiaA [Gammaproteobacteria bacterium]